MTDYVHGWYQLAFERDLSGTVTPLTFSGRPLMALGASGNGAVRVFDAVCPHRGADLGYGGRVNGETVVCPFHGHRIGLGGESADGFCVREYACVMGAGGLFVRLSDQQDPDFPRGLAELVSGHSVVPGFEMTVGTTMEVVIENGFDNAHFRSVHDLACSPSLAVRRGRYGELEVEGVFEIPTRGGPDGTSREPVRARYAGRAFSPGVFVAELDGAPPFRYRIMTTATPDASAQRCTIRLTLILPAGRDGMANAAFARELLEYSREGLERDRAIWDRLDLRHAPRLTPQDGSVVAFNRFCREFGRDHSPPAGS